MIAPPLNEYSGPRACYAVQMQRSKRIAKYGPQRARELGKFVPIGVILREKVNSREGIPICRVYNLTHTHTHVNFFSSRFIRFYWRVIFRLGKKFDFVLRRPKKKKPNKIYRVQRGFIRTFYRRGEFADEFSPIDSASDSQYRLSVPTLEKWRVFARDPAVHAKISRRTSARILSTRARRGAAGPLFRSVRRRRCISSA